MSMTPAMHPQGQCCKATFTMDQKNSPYESLRIGYNLDEVNISYEGIFTVFVPKILVMVSDFGFNPLGPLFGQ